MENASAVPGRDDAHVELALQLPDWLLQMIVPPQGLAAIAGWAAEHGVRGGMNISMTIRPAAAAPVPAPTPPAQAPPPPAPQE